MLKREKTGIPIRKDLKKDEIKKLVKLRPNSLSPRRNLAPSNSIPKPKKFNMHASSVEKTCVKENLHQKQTISENNVKVKDDETATVKKKLTPKRTYSSKIMDEDKKLNVAVSSIPCIGSVENSLDIKKEYETSVNKIRRQELENNDIFMAGSKTGLIIGPDGSKTTFLLHGAANTYVDLLKDDDINNKKNAEDCVQFEACDINVLEILSQPDKINKIRTSIENMKKAKDGKDDGIMVENQGCLNDSVNSTVEKSNILSNETEEEESILKLESKISQIDIPNEMKVKVQTENINTMIPEIQCENKREIKKPIPRNKDFLMNTSTIVPDLTNQSPLQTKLEIKKPTPLKLHNVALKNNFSSKQSESLTINDNELSRVEKQSQKIKVNRPIMVPNILEEETLSNQIDSIAKGDANNACTVKPNLNGKKSMGSDNTIIEQNLLKPEKSILPKTVCKVEEFSKVMITTHFNSSMIPKSEYSLNAYNKSKRQKLDMEKQLIMKSKQNIKQKARLRLMIAFMQRLRRRIDYQGFNDGYDCKNISKRDFKDYKDAKAALRKYKQEVTEHEKLNSKMEKKKSRKWLSRKMLMWTTLFNSIGLTAFYWLTANNDLDLFSLI